MMRGVHLSAELAQELLAVRQARLELARVEPRGAQLLDLALQLRHTRGMRVLQAGLPPRSACCVQPEVPQLLRRARMSSQQIGPSSHASCLMHGIVGYFRRQALCECQLHYSELTSAVCRYPPFKLCGIVYAG